MITRPPARPQSLLRAFVKQANATPSSFLKRQVRRKHTVPVWANQTKQDFFARHGVPGFLSAETYQETYVKYTQHLCDRLNELVLGTADESSSTYDLHAKCAHRSDRAHLYNLAAMVEFTRFFWEYLTENEDPAIHKPGLNTTRSIEASFGSVQNLREEMLETADAMFGNGFVWLMKGKNVGDMRILATYNAGSPYPDAAPRRDDKDMATFDGRILSDQLSGRGGLGLPSLEERNISTGNSTAGSFGDFSSSRANLYAGALDMQPILCVNVWEHQWLRDYGLLGKKWYLGAWWDRIDWQKVESQHALYETGGEWSDYWSSGSKSPYATTGGSSVLDALRR
ncbi:hypothetical protein AYO21_03669 [Fonsecaea monophora]|uniref:Manganese/iron superoxide dismutase C-terminal domain-containing protein n=2 Tax=Fonsecaea TaxID=40354 RepID=A0A0D2GPV2_9EURO|nr:uncharacterized protein Z517_07181 [Fonsecaea pedrosoi CBS 271.37]XP_022514167.1 hypothetical protein AYO21_03669 [Fonsecaea monophora]KAH0847964.1 Fe superoxide dismutase [Fonsecaea pedrosoi]KIW80565.1 hypothetical protein Z517_07181 [Fonsecaea pedrosoi CBS 271.37]OAG42215.1 hypothetical protein AYO21_03669 [Fonsecaea monophora]